MPVERIMNTPEVPTKGMSWDHRTRTYSTEASDFGWPAGHWPVRIVLIGQHTDRRLGCTVKMYKSEERELLWVDFHPVDPRFDFTIRIYND